MKYHDVIARLKEFGWSFTHGTNHILATSPDGTKFVPIPRHKGRDIKPGTLKAIERQSGIKLKS